MRIWTIQQTLRIQGSVCVCLLLCAPKVNLSIETEHRVVSCRNYMSKLYPTLTAFQPTPSGVNENVLSQCAYGHELRFTYLTGLFIITLEQVDFCWALCYLIRIE